MVVKLVLLLASIILLQQIRVNSTRLPPHHGESTGGSSDDGLMTDVEREYLNWVNHMDAYQSQLRKVEKKKGNKNKLKKNISCKKIIRVNKTKKRKNLRMGEFVSVREAVSSIPLVNKCRVIIYISAGTYKEKVEVPPTMGHITIKGKGADKTVIEWGDTADKLGKNKKPLGTYASATFAVNSLYFIAKNITFKNSAPPPPSGALGKQAVAMRVSGDKAAFVGCNFIGAQDTLYDHIGRHYFKECYIEGSIDFVFGNGLSLYENCHLHAATNTYGALTAQKRESLLEETGFSFVKCKVTGGSGVLYLGRAWGSFSRVVFAYTYMDKIITPKGWYDWGDKSRDMTVFYGQYKCWGPGAEYGGRVDWSRELTYGEAQPFISLDFIDGHEWLKESL